MKILLAILALASAFAPQYAYRLNGIQVIGAKRLSPRQVIALAGLKAPGVVQPKDVDAAQQRLVASGLFTKVAYSYRNARNSATLVISVDEPAWNMVVVFDNFLGIPDDRLKSAVALDVPTFDGFIPSIPGAAERVQRALERLARDSAQPGKVTFLPTTDRLMRLTGYRFRLDRASGPLRVCTVTVDGVPDRARPSIPALLRTLVDTDYSKNYIERYTVESLLPALAREGHVKATVTGIDAARDDLATSECAGRVRVAITIDAGPQYFWRRVSWTGNAVMAPDQLFGLLALKAGAPADSTALDRGLRAVADAYRRQGYLRVATKADTTYDDAARQADYAVTVAEGPQFRMGTIEMTGLDEALAAQVRALWQLAPGQPFDSSYPGRFIGDARMKFRATLTPYKPHVTLTQDPTALLVHVVVAFRSS